MICTRDYSRRRTRTRDPNASKRVTRVLDVGSPWSTQRRRVSSWNVALGKRFSKPRESTRRRAWTETRAEQEIRAFERIQTRTYSLRADEKVVIVRERERSADCRRFSRRIIRRHLMPIMLDKTTRVARHLRLAHFLSLCFYIPRSDAPSEMDLPKVSRSVLASRLHPAIETFDAASFRGRKSRNNSALVAVYIYIYIYVSHPSLTISGTAQCRFTDSGRAPESRSE